jgi:hypothetical protein
MVNIYVWRRCRPSFFTIAEISQSRNITAGMPYLLVLIILNPKSLNIPSKSSTTHGRSNQRQAHAKQSPEDVKPKNVTAKETPFSNCNLAKRPLPSSNPRVHALGFCRCSSVCSTLQERELSVGVGQCLREQCLLSPCLFQFRRRISKFSLDFAIVRQMLSRFVPKTNQGFLVFG